MWNEKDKNKEEDNMNITTIQRPNTPTESMKESMKQMELIREGKLPKRSWRDYIKEQKREQ
ncbi:hypothetical protein [Paenibacillus sp. QZ-Y1]|uniref:hypothetical protein n=1 Tax=Paenibacillus sp. QZ-Y1 TaxID=3414511 RepID=UPI003F7AFA0B